MPDPPYHIILDGSVIRPPVSGVHRAVREQLRALLRAADPSQYTFTLLTRDPELLENAANRGGVQAPRLPRRLRRVALRIAWQQWELPRIVRSRRAALLFAPAYTAPLRCAVPYVLQVHDMIAFDHPELCGRWNVLHMHALMPPAIRRAAAILTPSRFTAERVRARFPAVPEDRLVPVPLGVDTGLFADSARASGEAGSIPPEWNGCLLFVGNIEPKKGVEVLLEAYARCADSLGRPLVVVGRAAWKSGRLTALLREYAGPGAVYWAGRVSDARLAALYRAAWGFVFPSWEEGFGMPIIEAMAAGLPVIHSDAPALIETAGNAGIPFPRGDAGALCDALTSLARAPETYRDLREKGKRRARELSWAQWAARALAVFDRVLQRRKPGNVNGDNGVVRRGGMAAESGL